MPVGVRIALLVCKISAVCSLFTATSRLQLGATDIRLVITRGVLISTPILIFPGKSETFKQIMTGRQAGHCWCQLTEHEMGLGDGRSDKSRFALELQIDSGTVSLPLLARVHGGDVYHTGITTESICNYRVGCDVMQSLCKSRRWAPAHARGEIINMPDKKMPAQRWQRSVMNALVHVQSV